MDVSDLYISNPVISFQNDDLFYISVSDGIGGFNSGAFTWATLIAEIPTLYTEDGTLAGVRTVDQDGNKLLFQNGLFGIGVPTAAEVITRLHIHGDGERSLLGVGEFSGVEPLLHSVFSLLEGTYLAIVPDGSDIADSSTYRMLLGLGAGGDGITMSLYNQVNLRIEFSTDLGVNRMIAYNDANDGIFLIDEDGNCRIGTVTAPVDLRVDGNFGFNVAPVAQQPGLTAITHTAPGTPDYALQDLTAGGFGFATKDEGNTLLSVVKAMQDALKLYGLID